MTSRGCLFSVVAAGTLLFLDHAAVGQATDRIAVDRAVVVADPDQPALARFAVEDLADYLNQVTGRKISVDTTLARSGSAVLAIGPKIAAAILGSPLPAEKLGEEGYRLRTVRKDKVHYVIAAGATPRGTKAAVGALMKALEVEGNSAYLSASLDVTSVPTFSKRGMHLNGWAFNAPYSFRAWREREWQQYLDTLAYQGVNLFYLWPFMEIMPVPLSAEEQTYLEECRRVVEYAQKRHGMEVWIMHCANRVAKERCGVSDPRRRPYWRPSQEDLNPGNSEHFRSIMASREALYRILNNVDGVCIIDSDPGYCRDSSLDDYLKVLQGCRSLLDRHNLRGKQAKLVNWMWCGWGLPPERFFGPEHQATTIRAMQRSLAEPWALVSGRFEFLPVCRKQGVLGKTVLLPYGVIEGEPSYPATNIDFDGIRRTFDRHIEKCQDLQGVMGNVQTPLLQLPHVYFFTSMMWDLDYRKRPEQAVLRDLAHLIYPEHASLVAESYRALKERDPLKIESLASRLESLVDQDRLGRPGVFGRKLFPDHRILARTLIRQLQLRAAQERLFIGITTKTPEATCVKLLSDYFQAYLDWDTAHGWHGLWGWDAWPLGNFTSDPRFPSLCSTLGVCLGDKRKVEQCFDGVARALSAKNDAKVVQAGCIGPLKFAVQASVPIVSLAQKAKATASVAPDAARYPPGSANDGLLTTLYWPGALVHNNTEWLQLTWDTPQTFATVTVRFLQHPSMRGRTIRLQREASPQHWENFAAALIPADAKSPHAVATFSLPAPATVNKIRIVNLLDVFEVEVR